MEKDLIKDITHLKQSTIRMQGNHIIYFDPFGIEGNPKDADIIFITHSHYDHFSPEDIRKVNKVDTVLVLPEEFAKTAVKAGFENIVTVMPSEHYEVKGLQFDTVPAYNTDKLFHKKKYNWVGYIVNVNNASYYFAGDTDLIPEMKEIKADVAFLPVGGTYTMTWKEAVEAANTIKPEVAVPIHYADVVGSVQDAKNFANGVHPPICGVILK
jgi:L-ascorbate metabolism protein UlaG (beta-lactamase superfamily)